MKNSSQRLSSLKEYPGHLGGEHGQMAQVASRGASEPPDHVTNTIAIAAMILIFASIFLFQ